MTGKQENQSSKDIPRGEDDDGAPIDVGIPAIGYVLGIVGLIALIAAIALFVAFDGFRGLGLS